jgi:MYXO-CTERM domain-containing protein
VRSLVRRGPGVWLATVQLPSGHGGSKLTVGATFDGIDVVEPKSIPIATDVWEADYPPSVQGGCAVGGAKRGGWGALAMAGAIALLRRRAPGVHGRRARVWFDGRRKTGRNTR